MKEQETPRNELDERLRSLIKSSASGVKGLDPLIQDCIKEIMSRVGVTPETIEKFAKGGE